MKCDCRVTRVIRLLHTTELSRVGVLSPSCESSENLYTYSSDVICLETLLHLPSGQNILLNILNIDKIYPLGVDLIFGSGTMFS